MADGYGNICGNWRTHVKAWVTGYTDTTDTIHVEVWWQSLNGWNYYGWVAATAWINGQQVAHTSNSGNKNLGVNSEVCILAADLTVAKAESARNITCSGSIYWNGPNSGTSNSSCGVYTGGINYHRPNPPKNVSFKRVSDNKASISWQGNWDNNALKPWKQVLLAQRIALDGGNWKTWSDQQGGSGAVVLNWDKTNFDATNLRPNGRYQFAVYARNQAGDSTHVDSPVIYTTPRAPAKVEAVKTGAKSAQILIDLSGGYANGFDVQRRLAGADWQDLVTGSYAGKPAQVLDDDTPAGIVEYRARARRPIYGDDASKGVLTGEWTQSNQITTICPPDAPTITTPAQGATLATPLTLDIRWTPNHPDGSNQTAAQIELTNPDGTVTTASATTATTYRLQTNTDGRWQIRVRTKGLHADWGEWSQPTTIRTATPPNVTVTDPTTITASPFGIAWSVADTTGVAHQRVRIRKDGAVVYQTDLNGSARSLTIDQSKYLPENGAELIIDVTVQGGSTLTTTASRGATVAYTPPAAPTANIDIDGSNLSLMVTAIAGTPTADQPKTEWMSVTRLLDGDELTLSARLADGRQTIDRLPPLNRKIGYRITAHAASGAVSETTVTTTVTTDMCMLNFGTDAGEAIHIGGGFDISEKQSHDTEEYHFELGSDTDLPASYSSRRLDNQITASTTLDYLDGQLYQRIRRLARANTYAWWRNIDGTRAFVKAAISTHIKAKGPTATLDIDMTEILWEEPNN